MSCVGAPQSVAASARGRPLAIALAAGERLWLRGQLDAVAAAIFGLDMPQLRHTLDACDLRIREVEGPARGFWRVDKDKNPEPRHTVLTMVAFRGLENMIRKRDGDLAFDVLKNADTPPGLFAACDSLVITAPSGIMYV